MSLKHFVRDSWLTASYYTGLSQLYNALAGQKRGVISYHNVLPVSDLPPFDTYNVDVTAAVFDKQLTFLKKHFKVLPIQELENPKAKGVFLTIDDGMRNNYEILAPILEQHDLTALFAVCPAMIDGQLPHIWRDHLFLLLYVARGKEIFLPINDYSAPIQVPADLSTTQNAQVVNSLTRRLKKYVYEHWISDVYNFVREICEKNGWSYNLISESALRYQFMTWEQIQTLAQHGHQIASHTMTHRILRFLSDIEKQYEIVESKKRLENQLGTPIDVLVYPYGGKSEIDSSSIRIAAQAGYQMAFMNVRRDSLSHRDLSQPRFALPPITDAAHLHAIVSGYKFLFR